MKYIKLYEVFGYKNHVDSNTITDKELTMHEIFMELEDYGANINIHIYDEDSYGKILVINALDNISWGDVRECILRVKEYLGDDYVNLEYWLPNKITGNWINLNNLFEFDETITSPYAIKIGYK